MLEDGPSVLETVVVTGSSVVDAGSTVLVEGPAEVEPGVVVSGSSVVLEGSWQLE